MELWFNFLSVSISFSVRSLCVYVVGREQNLGSHDQLHLWKEAAALWASFEIYISWMFSCSQNSDFYSHQNTEVDFETRDMWKYKLLSKGTIISRAKQNLKNIFANLCFSIKNWIHVFILNCPNQQECGKWCITGQHWFMSYTLAAQEAWSLMSNVWVKQLTRAK